MSRTQSETSLSRPSVAQPVAGLMSVRALQRKERGLDQAGARLIAVADRERRRLERDLHDGAQQRLVSLSLRLGLLASRLAPGSEAEQLLADARNELAASLQELRDLARGLHPAILCDRGLPAALEALTARAPLPVELLVEQRGRVPEPVGLAAYYLVCEALTNILKHSDATSASVSVARRGTRLVVEVADDGAGGADRASGSGLRGLSDRIEALGGRLEVSSPPGAGTTLRAEIPLEQGPPPTERWHDQGPAQLRRGCPRRCRQSTEPEEVPAHAPPGTDAVQPVNPDAALAARSLDR